MGIAAVKIKILPISPETDLEELKEKAKSEIQKLGGGIPKFEVEEIAFGLKALIAFFAWPEEKELEALETSLGKVKNVSSVQITDIRRALG
jgi:elongation factor 1-beta